MDVISSLFGARSHHHCPVGSNHVVTTQPFTLEFNLFLRVELKLVCDEGGPSACHASRVARVPATQALPSRGICGVEVGLERTSPKLTSQQAFPILANGTDNRHAPEVLLFGQWL